MKTENVTGDAPDCTKPRLAPPPPRSVERRPQHPYAGVDGQRPAAGPERFHPLLGAAHPLPRHGRPSTERRCRRWLENPAIDPGSVYGPLITRALRDWGSYPLTLALDTSVLFGRFCLIRIAVLYRGRAVPLISRVLEHASAQVSTEQLLPVLAEAKGLLDFLGLHDIRLLADRGCCDTVLMGWLRFCGWHFRIRIISSLILAAPRSTGLHHW